MSRAYYICKVNRQHIILSIAVFLACLTPRFTGFLKINIGFNMSFYSIIVILSFLIYGIKRKVIISKQYNIAFMGLLLFFTIISITSTIDFVGWMQYLFYITTCLLFLILVLQNKNNTIYKLITTSIVVAFFIQIVIGLYEVYFGSYLFEVGGFSRRLYGTVPVSGFYNPNDYAMFVSTMIPFVAYASISTKNKLEKVAYVGIIIGALFLLFKIMSRATVLAFIFSVFAFFILLLKKKKYKGWVILFISFIIFSYLIIVPINTWVNSFIIQNAIDATSTSDYFRINLIKNGLYFLKETYGMGVGAGSLKRWFELYPKYNTGGILYIHNWYAEILVTFGIIVFILYFVFHVKIFIFLLKKIKKRDSDFNLTISFFISFIMFSVTSISSSSNIYSEWVWMYIALMVAYTEFCRKKENELSNIAELDEI